jgi:F-type H+-transporting ATPase subunit c
MMTQLLAQATAFSGSYGSQALAFAGLGAALGIGLIGYGATTAIGRNPGAKGDIQTLAIIAMALAEAIAIYALVLAFLKQ